MTKKKTIDRKVLLKRNSFTDSDPFFKYIGIKITSLKQTNYIASQWCEHLFKLVTMLSNSPSDNRSRKENKKVAQLGFNECDIKSCTFSKLKFEWLPDLSLVPEACVRTRVKMQLIPIF